MMLSTEEINKEKAAKNRPDLLPPAVVLNLLEHIESEHPVLEAYKALLAFAERPTERYGGLQSALFALAREIGGTLQAIDGAGSVMGYGAKKHGNCTWRVAGTEQADPQTHLASAQRHCLEYLLDPDSVEEGSGRPVLWHAFAQVCILINLVVSPPQLVGENDGLSTVTRRLEEARMPL
jgi:hypothetical protein